MSNDNNYCVYKHTSPEGKIYIGITSQENPESRWGHNGAGYKDNLPFYEDIQSFGWNNFGHEIIMEDLNKSEAKLIESSIIKAMKSYYPSIGYNKNEGIVDGRKAILIKNKNGNCNTLHVFKNQKIIQNNRKNDNLDFEATYKAMEILTKHGFNLYMYLVMHQKGEIFALSSKHVVENTGLTKSTYPKAIHNLIEEYYLIPGEIETDHGTYSTEVYHLFEYPANITNNM